MIDNSKEEMSVSSMAMRMCGYVVSRLCGEVLTEKERLNRGWSVPCFDPDRRKQFEKSGRCN